MRPQPRVQKKAHEQVTTVTPERPGIPRAMVLTGSFVLSPVTGRSCHCRRRKCNFRQLDASVGASGPHDFAVRVSAFRQAHRLVHRIPHPTSVTIAKRPSEEAGPNCDIPVSTPPSSKIRKIRNQSNPGLIKMAATSGRAGALNAVLVAAAPCLEWLACGLIGNVAGASHSTQFGSGVYRHRI
jgi:hypothetical protein